MAQAALEKANQLSQQRHVQEEAYHLLQQLAQPHNYYHKDWKAPSGSAPQLKMLRAFLTECRISLPCTDR